MQQLQIFFHKSAERFFGGMRAARTKPASVQGSKARLEAPMKDGHFSWKESQEIFAIPNVYRKLRGIGEISKAPTCLPL